MNQQKLDLKEDYIEIGKYIYNKLEYCYTYIFLLYSLLHMQQGHVQFMLILASL